MSDALAPPVAAPVAAPVGAPTPAPAAPANESLLPPPAAAPVAAPAPIPGDAPAWAQKVPEKFHVKGADGKVDIEATLLKQSESYTNLEKARPGAAPAAPAKPEDYTWTPPESLKDLKLDDSLTNSFREKAHKAGFTQAQYELALGEHFGMVSGVLDSVLAVSREDAKAELSKVWQSPAVFEAQMNNAQRTMSSLPADIQEEAHARFGRDPLFLRLAAHLGQGMREDTAPSNADGGAPIPQTLEQLQAHPAYRDPKHPEHAAYSKRAMEAAQRITPA